MRAIVFAIGVALVSALLATPDAATRESVAGQIRAYSAAWGETIAAPQQPGTRDAHCRATRRSG